MGGALPVYRLRTFRTVLVSYVLRLLPEELAHGRLSGEVEAVASGERRPVRGLDELLAFCEEALRAAPPNRRGEKRGVT